ncbi:MAG TPA: helix-turn-helix domain-containing protein [Candidatus Borkfalkia stercoripullorum]|nr:helix-turn-helix domain-containing protein [Candidatus Borkfalkia stercoripullorum]
MYSELKTSIQSVYQKTGIDVFLFSPEGKFLFSAAGEKPPFAFRRFGGVLQADGATFFKVLHRGAEYVCAIQGTGPVEKNYAVFLSDAIENTAGKSLNLPRGEFIRRILLGECSADDVQTYAIKYSVPESPCFALAVSSDLKAGELMSFLTQYAGEEADTAVAVTGKDCAFIKFMDEDTEYQSSADFANFLARSLLEEVGVKVRIGVGGTVRHFEEIASSYRQANTALRMSGIFNSGGEVHTYREFVLVKMLEDLPEAKLGEYLSILLDGEAKELLKDEDMVNTAEEFLENNLNVSETARNLYMHRNTLMYRLDKIERVMGLNLRNFSDAVTFRVITILYKLT